MGETLNKVIHELFETIRSPWFLLAVLVAVGLMNAGELGDIAGKLKCPP